MSAATQKQCLFPGYKQVDSFGPDEEYELEEEEVSYVTLDLGRIEPTLIPSSSTYRLIVSGT
jgi:general transcription factor 3C polypeptide 6